MTLPQLDSVLKKIFSDVFYINEDMINDKISCRSIENWKGLKHRELIQAIENNFDIKFDSSEIDTLINYKIIKATLIAHLS